MIYLKLREKGRGRAYAFNRVKPTRLDQILAANHGGGQTSEPIFLVLFGAAQPKRSAARAGHGKPWVLQHPTVTLAKGTSSQQKGRFQSGPSLFHMLFKKFQFHQNISFQNSLFSPCGSTHLLNPVHGLHLIFIPQSISFFLH